MCNLTNYIDTRASAIENWDIVTKVDPTKLSVKKDFRLWTFYEMFMDHIENMGRITSLVLAKVDTDYNIAKDFGQFRIETIETDYKDLEISI